MADNSPTTVSDLRDHLDDARTCMVTTVDERGTLTSRPLTVQKIDDSGDVWFLVSETDAWVKPADNSPINAALVDKDSTWASFAGRAELQSDQAKINELMDEVSETFFNDDSTPIALRVVTDRIEWWTAPGSVATMIEMAKSKATDSQPDLGDSGTIEV